MLRFLIILLLSLTASGAASQTMEALVDLQTAVALNGSQAARTSDTIVVRNHARLHLHYSYTFSAGTDFALYCEQSVDNTLWSNIDVPNSIGYKVLGDPIYQYSALGVSAELDFEVGVAGMFYVRCYPTVAGAAAGDLIDSSYILTSVSCR